MMLGVLLYLFQAISNSQSDEESIRGLLRELGSDEPTVRDRAQTRLDALGLAAKPVLKRCVEQIDPEIKGRVEAQLTFLDLLQLAEDSLEFFDKVGPADYLKKPFVRYNTGFGGRAENTGQAECEYAVGWLLSETDSTVSLYQGTLTQNRYSKSGWTSGRLETVFADKQSPVAGRHSSLNFETYCKELLDPNLKAAARGYPATGRPDESIELSLFAYTALRMGHHRLCVELWKRIAKQRSGRSGTPEISDQVATYCRRMAILDAGGGRTIPDLIASWSRIAAISRGKAQDEAHELLKLYEQAAKRQAEAGNGPPARTEDPSRAFQKRLDELEREAARIRIGLSGRVELSEFLDLDNSDHKVLSGLLAGGWKGIPFLIAALDDPRPTRCVYERRLGSSSWPELLRIGDCCALLLARLTLRPLSLEDRLDHSRSRAVILEQKEKALEWWGTMAKTDPVSYYGSLLLPKEGFSPSFAAEGLLRETSGRALERVLKAVNDPNQEDRSEVLQAAGPYLGKSDQPVLEELLRDSQSAVRSLAAKLLWKQCGSKAGVDSIIRASETEPAIGLNAITFAWRHEDTGYDEEVLARLMQSTTPSISQPCIVLSAMFPSRMLADRLVQLLGSKEDCLPMPTGIRYRYRVCDLAARSLAIMCDRPNPAFGFMTATDRDSEINSLREWWSSHAQGIDWKVLARSRMQDRLKVYGIEYHEFWEGRLQPERVECASTDLTATNDGGKSWDESRLQKEFVEKPLDLALDRLKLEYANLLMVDEPPGKLRAVRWTRQNGAKTEDVTFVLKYSQDLFSKSRTWDENLVKKTSILNVVVKKNRD